jgi:hypothetical protein
VRKENERVRREREVREERERRERGERDEREKINIFIRSKSCHYSRVNLIKKLYTFFPPYPRLIRSVI